MFKTGVLALFALLSLGLAMGCSPQYPLPDDPPQVGEMSRTEAGRAIARRVGVGVVIILDHDSYLFVSQEKFESLLREYKASNPAPSPGAGVASTYEEKFREFVQESFPSINVKTLYLLSLGNFPLAAVGVAYLNPPPIAWEHGYHPGEQYPWVMYFSAECGVIRIFLVDIRREIGFEWELPPSGEPGTPGRWTAM